MNMDELRGQIDAIDSQLVELYKQRLDVADRIGAYKRENGLPIYDSERERRLLNKVGEQAGEERASSDQGRGACGLHCLLRRHSDRSVKGRRNREKENRC